MPTDHLAPTLGDLVRSLGFAPIHTGGNCMAYSARVNPGIEVMLTDTSGAYLPEHGETVLIGIYHMDHGDALWIDDFDFENPAALRGALCAVLSFARKLAKPGGHGIAVKGQ